MDYIYIVKVPTFERVKIGYWNGNVKTLKMRYVTPYGNDITRGKRPSP